MNRDLRFYPDSYDDSRLRFCKAAKSVDGASGLGQWSVPSKTHSDLTVDWCWFPASGEPVNLIVVTSGVHGAEAYAGAAIQNLLLTEIIPSIDRTNTGLLLVHAMNPFGFAQGLRCTENHVNLNRNFSVSGEIYTERNILAKEFNRHFLRREPVDGPRSRLLSSVRREAGGVYFDQYTLDELIKAVAPGQFENEGDLEFGGFRPEPQAQLLIDKVREIAKPYKTIFGFDIHTGLGDRGRLHLLTGGCRRPNDPDLFRQTFKIEEDRDVYEFTPPKANGFYSVKGAASGIYGDLASADQRVVAMTLEFGTNGHDFEKQLESLNYMVLELQARHHGYASKEIEDKLRKATFELSFPSDEAWRLQVIETSRKFFSNVFRRLPKKVDSPLDF